MKHNIHPDLMPLATPIDDLHQDPANARTDHDIVRLAGSLAQYGQRKPMVVNRSEANKIEAGNGTWQAAKFLGWTHVAAVFVEDSPTTAAAFAIADNRLAELSRWDYEALQTLIDSIDPDLGLETGFAEGEMEEMLRAAGIDPLGDAVGEPGDAEPRIDHAAELAAEWGVQPGQIWRLPSRVEGQYHLLACGDCTDVALVQRLMAGEAKWSDVTAAIRLAVQELRHEYGDDVTTVKVEAAEIIPEWMTAVARMDTEQLDRIITNLSLVESDG